MDYQSYEEYIRGTVGYQNKRSDDPYNIYSVGTVPPTNYTASVTPVNPVTVETPLYAVQPTSKVGSVAAINSVEDERYAMTEDMDMDETALNEMYPDIYKIIIPMVSQVVDQNVNITITKEALDRMVDEVCNNFEADEPQNNRAPEPVLRNGDVVNPRAVKIESPVETRQRNFLLNDFVRVLP